MPAAYDRIGLTYRGTRCADPRIQSHVDLALGDAATVVNVGAGTGSYEPVARDVVAVEPSGVMLRQRPIGSAPAVRAIAEHLPFRDGSFDAAMAVLTIHHWSDWRRGIAELRRVARSRVVVLTWDPDGPGFWLLERYFPEFRTVDANRFPSIELFARTLGASSVSPVPIPHDCQDGFLGAYWRRPAAYLDPEIRAGMSVFADIPGHDRRLVRLASELAAGVWTEEFGGIADMSEADLGYRLVVCEVES